LELSAFECCKLDDLDDGEHVLGKGKIFQASLAKRLKEVNDLATKLKACMKRMETSKHPSCSQTRRSRSRRLTWQSVLSG
jgi:hypothetical protein